MSLETLKDLKEVNGYEVHDYLVDRRGYLFSEGECIIANIDDNVLAFKIQNGPIKEFGVNGCQVDEIIAVARHMILGLHNQLPSLHNKKAMDALSLALFHLTCRKNERVSRNVEGTSQE